MGILNIVQSMIDSGEDLRLQLFRGVLEGAGNMPAASYYETNNGTPRFRGCVKVMDSFVNPNTGEVVEFGTLMPLSVWGDEAAMYMHLEEGDRVMVLGKYSRKKMQDGGYWTECEILAVEVLD